MVLGPSVRVFVSACVTVAPSVAVDVKGVTVAVWVPNGVTLSVTNMVEVFVAGRDAVAVSVP